MTRFIDAFTHFSHGFQWLIGCQLDLLLVLTKYGVKANHNEQCTTGTNDAKDDEVLTFRTKSNLL